MRSYRLPALAPGPLRQWRVEHNYSAAELAAELGVSTRTYARWEAGESDAPWQLLRLALHGLAFRHAETCRCGNPLCRNTPSRYGVNGRQYDPH